MPSKVSERINFGKIKEVVAPPNLIELQTTSYLDFYRRGWLRQNGRTPDFRLCSLKSFLLKATMASVCSTS
jgi:hypothetical protein